MDKMKFDFKTRAHPLERDFKRLQLLQDGWDGEGSVRISAEALDFCAELTLSAAKSVDLSTAELFGRYNGGVSIRWRVGYAFFDLEIDPEPKDEVSFISLSGRSKVTGSLYRISGEARDIGANIKNIVTTGVKDGPEVDFTFGVDDRVAKPKTRSAFWRGFWQTMGFNFK